MGILRVFITLILLVSPCFSADWYVSQSGTGAKDGSIDAPWAIADIDTKWTSMSAGDTLYIIGVINPTAFSIELNGITGVYTTISGYDSTSMIDLTYNKASTLSWSEVDEFGAYALTSVSAMGEIVGYAEWTTTSGPIGWTELIVQTKVPDEDWVAGSAYYNATTSTLYWKPLGGTMIGKTLSVGSGNGIVINGKSWIKINSLKVYGGFIQVGAEGHSENILLDNITVDALHSSVAVRTYDCDYLTLSNSTLKNGKNGLWNTLGDDYFTISNNIFTDFIDIVGNDAHCIGLYDGGQNWIIENNDLSYANTGITLYGSEINNNIIRYNYVHNMEGARGDGRGYGIGFEGALGEDHTRTGNYIYSNIVANNDGFGINALFSDANNYIYNNTIYNCSPNLNISGVVLNSIKQPSYGVVKNNISYNPAIGSYHVNLVVNSSGYNGVVFDYNSYYPDTDSNDWCFGCGGTAYTKSFAEWKTELTNAGVAVGGRDANSITSDPSLSTTTFMIGSSSTAINAGTSVGLSRDYFGNGITGLPDIGAHEYRTTPVSHIGSGASATIGSGAVMTFY